MKPILIVVSTFNRRDLTGLALDSISRNKSSLSDVLVIDDASNEYDVDWLKRWSWPVIGSLQALGVGLAAFRRFREFIGRDYAYICAIDNDVAVCRDFDVELLRIFCAANDSNMTVASGYRSVTQVTHTDKGTGCLLAKTVNGINQFTDRATALRITDAMEGKWEHPWDANLSKVLSRIAVPRRSFIQHLGIHGSGVNGLSEDTAVDFVGDGFRVWS